MKKTAILFFLVLAIILSLFGCTASHTEKNSSSKDFDQETMLWVVSEIDTCFDSKHSDGYGGIRQSFYNDIKQKIDDCIVSSTEEDRPYAYSLECLSHPENTEGFFQTHLYFEEASIEKTINLAFSSRLSKAFYFFRNSSKEDIEKAIHSLVEQETQNAPEGMPEFDYTITQLDIPGEEEYYGLLISFSK